MIQLINTHGGYRLYSRYNSQLSQAIKAAGGKWDGEAWTHENGNVLRQVTRQFGNITEIDMASVRTFGGLIEAARQHGINPHLGLSGTMSMISGLLSEIQARNVLLSVYQGESDRSIRATSLDNPRRFLANDGAVQRLLNREGIQ